MISAVGVPVFSITSSSTQIWKASERLMRSLILHGKFPSLCRVAVLCKSCAKKSANLFCISFHLKVWWQRCTGGQDRTWRVDSRLRLTTSGITAQS